MAYVGLARLKGYLGISGTKDDVLLYETIESAQSMIDAHTSRTFEASSDSSRTFDSVSDVDGPLLYFDEDLASITTITNGDGDTVSSSDYTTQPRNGTPYYAVRLLASSSESWESQSDGDSEDAITVTGRWAYSTAAPNDIEQACVRLAAYLYRQKDNLSDIDRPVLVSSAITLLPGELPRDVKLILDPYVRRLIR